LKQSAYEDGQVVSPMHQLPVPTTTPAINISVRG